MKIIQIGSYPIDASCIKGGVEASVYGLALELAKTHEVQVMDNPRFDIKNDFIQENGAIQIFRFYCKGTKNAETIFRIKNIIPIIRKQKPDICHIHSTSLFSLLMYILLKINRVPCIVTVHGLAHIEKLKSFRKKRSIKNYFKYITQSLTEFIFLSLCPVVIVDTEYVNQTIKLYKKKGKIVRLPICKVIPQGINPVFFQLEHIESENKILSVGAFSKRKGHYLLIVAMEKVKTVCPDFKLVIAGVLSDTQYFESLQKDIKDRGLDQNITLLTNLSFDEILKTYKSASLFVLHSEEESQGIVFCEAMAAGKPIVATNVGGIPWVVENEVNGLLSDYGDIDTFAKNIIRLFGNENRCKEMAETNRIQSQKYNWKIIANEIVVLYSSIIKSTNQSAN
jgi:glycosyltransferase involved in cell wall biosynthesis